MILRFLRMGGWVVLILLSFGGGYGWLAWSQRATSLAIEERGMPAVASIEGMRTETHRRRTKTGMTTDTDYLVTYAYLALPEPGAAPIRIEVEHRVPRFVYDELSRGEEVDIRYLPEDQERADFFAGETERDSGFMVIGAVVFTVIALLVAPIPAFMDWRAHRIATRGIPAQGTLEQSRRWNEQWRLTVRFRDADGVERQATAFVDDRARWSGVPLGSPVSLRYDPANPSSIGVA